MTPGRAFRTLRGTCKNITVSGQPKPAASKLSFIHESQTRSKRYIIRNRNWVVSLQARLTEVTIYQYARAAAPLPRTYGCRLDVALPGCAVRGSLTDRRELTTKQTWIRLQAMLSPNQVLTRRTLRARS